MKHALLLMALWAIISVGSKTASQAQEPNLQGQSETRKKTEIGTEAAPVSPSMSAQAGQRATPALAPRADPWPKLDHNPAGRTLLIHSTPRDARVMAEIEEDLNVMARVLEKTVVQQVKSAPVRKLGLILHANLQQSPEAIYLDDYGALFLLRVSIPLVPPPPPHQKPAEAEAPRADAWEQTRQELYGGVGPATGFIPPSEPAADYNEALVASLKAQLLQALGNAARIRQLKPEEFVTVTLVGSPNESGSMAARSGSPNAAPGITGGSILPGFPGSQSFGASGFGAQSYSAQSFSGSASSGGGFTGEIVSGGAFGVGGFASSFDSRPGTTLTLRVSKADAAAFADGALSPVEFEKKVAIRSYVGNPAPSGGASFFTQPDR